MHWVTRVKHPQGFEPGSPAWEADDLPTKLSLPTAWSYVNANDLYSQDMHIDIAIYTVAKLVWHSFAFINSASLLNGGTIYWIWGTKSKN